MPYLCAPKRKETWSLLRSLRYPLLLAHPTRPRKDHIEWLPLKLTNMVAIQNKSTKTRQSSGDRVSFFAHAPFEKTDKKIQLESLYCDTLGIASFFAHAAFEKTDKKIHPDTVVIIIITM